MITIRSQKKGALTEARSVYIDGNKRILADPEAFILGDYSSFERCLEILDEIQSEIRNAAVRRDDPMPFYQMPAE
jgi:hypothetical protein